jgi:hypothetical protein
MKRVLILLLLVGCARMEHVAEEVGLTDPPAPPPLTVDLLCDTSPGAPANASTLTETLDVVLPQIAARPHSILRVWSMGDSVADAAVVGSVESTLPKKSGAQARKTHEERFLTTARTYLQKAAEPLFTNTPRRSPIAETMSKMLLSTTLGARHLVVITDAREVSDLGNFECGHLPTTEEWLSRLHAARVLTPGSLRSTHVYLVHVEHARIDRERCPVTMQRIAQTNDLWRAAFQAAGAASVTITNDALTLEGDEP